MLANSLFSVWWIIGASLLLLVIAANIFLSCGFLSEYTVRGKIVFMTFLIVAVIIIIGSILITEQLWGLISSIGIVIIFIQSMVTSVSNHLWAFEAIDF